MSDPISEQRHKAHEEAFADNKKRIGGLEVTVTEHENWITGGKAPNRGAEARLSRLEKSAGQGWLTFVRFVLPALLSALAVVIAAKVIP